DEAGVGAERCSCVGSAGGRWTTKVGVPRTAFAVAAFSAFRHMLVTGAVGKAPMSELGLAPAAFAALWITASVIQPLFSSPCLAYSWSTICQSRFCSAAA